MGAEAGLLHVRRTAVEVSGRTAATLALQRGASTRDVMLMLGHGTPLTTLTRYAWADVPTQRDAANRVLAAVIAGTGTDWRS